MTNDELVVCVRDLITTSIPSKDEILEAIKEGTRLALDQCWASEIMGAIADGTREAMNEAAKHRA